MRDADNIALCRFPSAGELRSALTTGLPNFAILTGHDVNPLADFGAGRLSDQAPVCTGNFKAHESERPGSVRA
jgi:hypothetical protein